MDKRLDTGPSKTTEKVAILCQFSNKTVGQELDTEPSPVLQRTTGADVQKYHFLYDNFGNTTSIGIGGWNSSEKITLASYEYAAMNGLLTTQTYGNEDYVEFTYDILGRAKTTTYKDENGNVDRILAYVYTGDGQLYSIHDSRTGFLYLYTYDSIGRLIGSSVKNADGEVLMSTRQEYNANNQLVGQHWTVGSTTYSETYTYNTTDGALTSCTNALDEELTFNYDSLRRLSSVTGGIYERKYNYRDIGTDKTTSFVSGYHYKGENGLPVYSFSYTYDTLGNIASYTEASGTQVYTYDDQNQLTTVRNASGAALYSYTYDDAGNILTASDGTTTNSYSYGNALWKDQLTAFNGQTITYDGSGNPLNYYNGKSYTFTWEEGRNLVSAVQGTNTYTYAYDSDGLRTSKTVNGVIHNYLYAGGKLIRETYGSTALDFVYDVSGYPYALIYQNGTAAPQTYYYITNLQGDVLYLLDSNKQEVATYTYDPYGRPLNPSADGTIAAINPLRYRGYYYDSEIELYYLQSRYYDPAVCRFINSDSYVGTGQGFLGYNMFAYCRNNPISRADYAGTLDMDQCDDDDVPLNNDINDFFGGGNGYDPQQAILDVIYLGSSSSPLPRQGYVSCNPSAPPVNAGAQGKHVVGHNNYISGRSTWPNGTNGVSQTQEAWMNGVPDSRKGNQLVRIGIASDGTIVRVHMSHGAIHGYPYYPYWSTVEYLEAPNE